MQPAAKHAQAVAWWQRRTPWLSIPQAGMLLLVSNLQACALLAAARAHLAVRVGGIHVEGGVRHQDVRGVGAALARAICWPAARGGWGVLSACGAHHPAPQHRSITPHAAWPGLALAYVALPAAAVARVCLAETQDAGAVDALRKKKRKGQRARMAARTRRLLRPHPHRPPRQGRRLAAASLQPGPSFVPTHAARGIQGERLLASQAAGAIAVGAARVPRPRRRAICARQFTLQRSARRGNPCAGLGGTCCTMGCAADRLSRPCAPRQDGGGSAKQAVWWTGSGLPRPRPWQPHLAQATRSRVNRNRAIGTGMAKGE